MHCSSACPAQHQTCTCSNPQQSHRVLVLLHVEHREKGTGCANRAHPEESQGWSGVVSGEAGAYGLAQGGSGFSGSSAKRRTCCGSSSGNAGTPPRAPLRADAPAVLRMHPPICNQKQNEQRQLGESGHPRRHMHMELLPPRLSDREAGCPPVLGCPLPGRSGGRGAGGRAVARQLLGACYLLEAQRLKGWLTTRRRLRMRAAACQVRSRGGGWAAHGHPLWEHVAVAVCGVAARIIIPPGLRIIMAAWCAAFAGRWPLRAPCSDQRPFLQGVLGGVRSRLATVDVKVLLCGRETSKICCKTTRRLRRATGQCARGMHDAPSS